MVNSYFYLLMTELMDKDYSKILNHLRRMGINERSDISRLLIGLYKKQNDIHLTSLDDKMMEMDKFLQKIKDNGHIEYWNMTKTYDIIFSYDAKITAEGVLFSNSLSNNTRQKWALLFSLVAVVISVAAIIITAMHKTEIIQLLPPKK